MKAIIEESEQKSLKLEGEEEVGEVLGYLTHPPPPSTSENADTYLRYYEVGVVC